MKKNEKKYVDQHRAAALLRLAEKELTHLSGQAGLGRREDSSAGAQIFYSYDDLRQICRLTMHRAG